MRDLEASVTSTAVAVASLDGFALDLRGGIRLVGLEHLDRGDAREAFISKPGVPQEQPSEDHPVG